jgi:hypothetical protein
MLCTPVDLSFSYLRSAMEASLDIRKGSGRSEQVDIKRDSSGACCNNLELDVHVCQHKQACTLVQLFEKSHDTVPFKEDIKETAVRAERLQAPEHALAPDVITWKRLISFANTSRLVVCTHGQPFEKSHVTVPLKLDIKETALAPDVRTWKRRNSFANTSRPVLPRARDKVHPDCKKCIFSTNRIKFSFITFTATY